MSDQYIERFDKLSDQCYESWIVQRCSKHVEDIINQINYIFVDYQKDQKVALARNLRISSLVHELVMEAWDEAWSKAIQCSSKNRKDNPMSKVRPVIICTEYRGVFFGYASDTSGDVIHLNNARMVIRWGTTDGLMELAEKGPTAKTKLSATADIEVRKITAVIEISDSALSVWSKS